MFKSGGREAQIEDEARRNQVDVLCQTRWYEQWARDGQVETVSTLLVLWPMSDAQVEGWWTAPMPLTSSPSVLRHGRCVGIDRHDLGFDLLICHEFSTLHRLEFGFKLLISKKNKQKKRLEFGRSSVRIPPNAKIHLEWLLLCMFIYCALPWLLLDSPFFREFCLQHTIEISHLAQISSSLTFQDGHLPLVLRTQNLVYWFLLLFQPQHHLSFYLFKTTLRRI